MSPKAFRNKYMYFLSLPPPLFLSSSLNPSSSSSSLSLCLFLSLSLSLFLFLSHSLPLSPSLLSPSPSAPGGDQVYVTAAAFTSPAARPTPVMAARNSFDSRPIQDQDWYWGNITK